MPKAKLIEARFVPSQHGFWKGKGKGCLEALKESGEFPLKSFNGKDTMQMTINREMTAFDVVINSLKTDARITKEDLVKIAEPDIGASASKLWSRTVSRLWEGKMSKKSTGIWGYKLDFLNFADTRITDNTPPKRKWQKRSEEEKYEIRRRCTLLKNVFTFIGANDKDRRQNLMKQLRDDIKKKHSSAAQKAVVDNFVRNSLTLAEDDTTTITLYHRPDDDGNSRPPFNIKMFRWWSNSKREMTGEGAAKRATSLRKAFEWYEKNLENIEYWFDFNQKIIWPVALTDTKSKHGWNTIKTLKIEELYPKKKDPKNLFGFDAASRVQYDATQAPSSAKVAAAAADARDKNRSGEYVDRRGNPKSSASSSSSAQGAPGSGDNDEEEEEEEEKEEDKSTKERMSAIKVEESSEEEKAIKEAAEDLRAKVTPAAIDLAAAAITKKKKTGAAAQGGGRRRRGGTKRRRNSKHRKSKRRKNSKKIRKKARKSKRRKSRRKKKSKKRRR